MIESTTTRIEAFLKEQQKLLPIRPDPLTLISRLVVSPSAHAVGFTLTLKRPVTAAAADEEIYMRLNATDPESIRSQLLAYVPVLLSRADGEVLKRRVDCMLTDDADPTLVAMESIRSVYAAARLPDNHEAVQLWHVAVKRAVTNAPERCPDVAVRRDTLLREAGIRIRPEGRKSPRLCVHWGDFGTRTYLLPWMSAQAIRREMDMAAGHECALYTTSCRARNWFTSPDVRAIFFREVRSLWAFYESCVDSLERQLMQTLLQAQRLRESQPPRAAVMRSTKPTTPNLDLAARLQAWSRERYPTTVDAVEITRSIRTEGSPYPLASCPKPVADGEAVIELVDLGGVHFWFALDPTNPSCIADHLAGVPSMIRWTWTPSLVSVLQEAWSSYTRLRFRHSSAEFQNHAAAAWTARIASDAAYVAADVVLAKGANLCVSSYLYFDGADPYVKIFCEGPGDSGMTTSIICFPFMSWESIDATLANVDSGAARAGASWPAVKDALLMALQRSWIHYRDILDEWSGTATKPTTANSPQVHRGDGITSGMARVPGYVHPRTAAAAARRRVVLVDDYDWLDANAVDITRKEDREEEPTS